jgi:Flp pilus assembly protein CpaB
MSMNHPYGNTFEPRPFTPGTPGPQSDKAPEKKVTRRVVSRYTRLALVAAVVLGLLGFLALSSSTAPDTFVARTATAVPAQTAMGESQLEVVAIDAAYVEQGAIAGSDPDEVRAAALELVGSGRTVVALPAGRQLHPADFSAVPVGVNGLEADERLISVTASVAAAAGGTVKAGDRVDVYGTVRDGATTLAGIVLVDVEVIAILPAAERVESASADQANPDNRDKTAAELLPARPIPGTYLLRVSASDAARLLAVVAGGDLHLALRAADAEDVVPLSAETLSVLCGTAPGSPVPTVEAPFGSSFAPADEVALPALCLPPAEEFSYAP